MGDPADRYACDRKESGQPAADIAEGAEGFQPGDPGGHDIARAQRCHILKPAFFLGRSAGQDSAAAAVRLVFEPLHQEAYWFAHPGNQRDIPGGPLRDADGPFHVRDDALHAGHFHMQIVFRVA